MDRREALAHARQQFEASPELRADAARDAVVLLLHTLDVSRAELLASPQRELSAQEQAAYEGMVKRRVASEPVQYITGRQEFYGLTLDVTPAVLIPRPETEHLVEAVLAALDPTQALRILDVGTGSGAIAIALATHLPNAQITASDISPAALEVARANAARHNPTRRIRFVESDLLAALAGTEAFDAIVSNPPYVPEGERETLHPQVREYEPAVALFAGPAGLDIYRRLIPEARAALRPGGLLALEIGHGQRDAVRALLDEWNAVRFVDDLQQIPRVALANKS
jgi:release factor glutamine methyltransferase